MTTCIKSVRWIALLALVACLPAAAQITYTTKLTSGPFLVVPTAQSVDWVAVNNDSEPVNIRVTVFKLILGGPKVAIAPGAVTVALVPGGATHNANSVPAVFVEGFYYEVVVESTSDKVQPAVNQWSGSSPGFIPGSLIPAGDFVEIKMPKPPKP